MGGIFSRKVVPEVQVQYSPVLKVASEHFLHTFNNPSLEAFKKCLEFINQLSCTAPACDISAIAEMTMLLNGSITACNRFQVPIDVQRLQPTVRRPQNTVTVASSAYQPSFGGASSHAVWVRPDERPVAPHRQAQPRRHIIVHQESTQQQLTKAALMRQNPLPDGVDDYSGLTAFTDGFSTNA